MKHGSNIGCCGDGATPAAAPQDVPQEGALHGLTLLHTCRTGTAGSGELVTFSMYLLNVGTEALDGVRLVPRRFSNADMAVLEYTDFPAAEDLNVGTLLPGTHVGWTARYRVSCPDVLSGGPIISSMAATAITRDGLLVRDESDAILNVQWVDDED